MRQVHTLRICKGGTRPSHILFVDTVLTLRPGEAGKSPPYFTHGPVSTVATDIFDDKVRQRQASPMSGEHWLTMLARRCRRGTSHWLIGRCIYQQLATIGFFRLVDGQTWQMQAPAEGKAKHKRSKEWAGFVVLEDKTTIIVLRRAGGGVLHIVDTSNFGADLGHVWAANPECNVRALADWWRNWTDWIERNHAGSVKYTVGSQAMAFFRGRHLHDPICVHTHERALELEGRSLYGGRCEVNLLGRLPGTVYHLDARSLYGWVAANCNVPVQLVDYAEGEVPGGVLDDPGIVADVTVEMDDPVFPYREPGKDLTIWPVGRFRTVLCAPELSLARERICEVHAAAVYRLSPALASFAAACWALRCREEDRGNRTIAKQIKLFSQVLYGKFAQRFRGWRYSPGDEPPAPWSLWWQMDKEKKVPVAWRSIAGRVERHVDGGFTDQACPVISAWIASAARVRLWQLMELARRPNVYYVDTDSLFVSSLGFERLSARVGTIGTDLGQLRVEGSYKDVEIMGWKHYFAGGKLVCAGFDRRARPGFTSHDGPPKIEPVSESCRQRRPPVPLAVQSHATFGGQYRHGQVLPDGRVVPFCLST